MIIDQPTMLPGAFAQNGDKNIIPSNNDGLTGLASIEKGFPPITQQPLASGGLPPQRADFNGIFNWLSLFNVFYQNGGIFAYSEELDYDVSNFVTDGTDLYKCIKENGAGTDNGVQPLSNTTYWDKMLTVGTSANVNYTINDSTGPSDNYGTLISLLSEFANRIKVIGGVNNWYNNPSISLLTLSNLVSNLASGSDVQWIGTKFTNAKLGISGLIAQNGYIQFGPNFGGLIIQWGMQEGYITLPISATVLIAVVCNRQDSGEYADADNFSQTGVAQYANAISTWSWYAPSDGSPHSLNWIAICKQ